MATKTANAKSAALEALIEAHAGELKLPTVKARFRAMAAEATRSPTSPHCWRQSSRSAQSGANGDGWSKPASR